MSTTTEHGASLRRTGNQIRQQSGYRPDIEGLRGIAVGLVVFYHASTRLLHGGFLGVDVFFVISGYLITGLLLREIEQTGRLSLAGFYARRARRLLPSSALVFLATILACTLFLSPLQQFRLGHSGSHTALYVSNFWFLRQSTNYFAPSIAGNPFLHTWSLAVEEQFYLVWPAVVLVGARGLRSRRALFGLMIFLFGASLALSLWFTARLAPWAFFNPLARAWEFAVGGIALLLTPWQLPLSSRWRAVPGWLGLAAILGSALLLQGGAGWKGWQALIPVFGAAAILHARVPQAGAARFLELPFMQWTGRVSYVWYLWHWPLFALVAAGGREQTPFRHLIAIVVCVAGSLGLAAATHALLEDPIRFNRFLAPRRALTLACAGMITVVTAGTAMAWQQAVTQAAHSIQNHSLVEAAEGSGQDDASCPPVSFLDTAVAECASGNPASKLSVVLFGDSHARQWYPAFQEIANDRGWRVVLIRKPACPTARLTVFNLTLNRSYTECDTWREEAIQRILAMHPAAVVIANRQGPVLAPGLKVSDDAWREASSKTLEALNAAGLPTILLRDTPDPGFDVPDCLSGDRSWWAKRRASGKSLCMVERSKALDEGVFRAEQQAATGLAHVRVVDLSDLFCDGALCEPVKSGLVVYGDDNHISEAFARSLAPELGVRLAPLVANGGP